MTAAGSVLLIGRREVAARLDLGDCIDVVERAFRLLGEGRLAPPAALGFPVSRGGFHVKAGVIDLGSPYLAVKTNGNFPCNPEERGLPTIQGVIVIADADDGRPLAVMDSIEITLRRTAAATAVAARHLARARSEIVTICGCGAQAPVQLAALVRVLPIRKAFAFDRDAGRARRLAEKQSAALGIEIEPVERLAAATRRSDAWVTCTTSSEYVLGEADVREGAFVAAVGADSAGKREVHPGLMGRATVVVDDLEQCSAIGDLHHALAAGALDRGRVHAELAAVVAGKRPGRTSESEITLFDSTGIALEDAAAAALVYERARADGGGLAVLLAD